MGGFSKLLISVAFLLVLHAAYSLVHYNKLVVAAGGAKDHIPMDIFAELGGGFAIMLLGITSLAGKFQPIFSESVAARPYDVALNRPFLATYDHRGRAVATFQQRE